MKRLVENEDSEQKVKKAKDDIIKEKLSPGKLYVNKIHDLPKEFNDNAISLREILEEIQPINSIHFNFMIDFCWLIEQYPFACRDAPITLVVGEKMGTSKSELRKDIGTMKNINVATARIPIPYGTHHTKLSLFEDDNSYHIIVSTSNLIEKDWEAKTQVLYYTKGSLLKEGEEKEEFLKNDMIQYLSYYKLPEVAYWIDRLKAFSFPNNGDRLIFSYPGYHKESEMHNVGHLSARKKLAIVQRKSSFTSRLFVFQCSSIGSLGANFQAWIEPQFLKSMKGGKTDGTGRTFVIYPTISDVKGSILGYASGGSLPYSKDTAKKQNWMETIFCKWRSEVLGRSRFMPHCKTYTELLDGEPQWIIVTSANLSKAAWGEMQKNCTQLMVRSYEMGVLVTDPKRIILPYGYPLQKYTKDDKPWLCDANYLEEDCLGNQWINS